jgi:hypothetical protein
MADEDLEQAERLLAKYADENNCGWCRKKARTLKEAASELRRASPKAMDLTDRFKDELDSRNLDNLEAEVDELRSQADRNRKFRERLDEVLDAPERPRRRERPLQTRAPPLPDLPPIVTPDDVGRQESEERRRFMEEAERRTGPVRTEVRYRLWKRLNRAEQREGPLQRRMKE